MSSNSADSGRPRLLIRADAGRSIGFGHFVRSMALARYLAPDFRVEVASFNPAHAEGEEALLSEWQRAQIEESGARFLPISYGDRREFDAAFLAAVGEGEIVVLDNYYFTTEYQRDIRRRGARLVCIDDMHQRHFVADMVMTFCPLRREEFSLEPYTRFYGGLEWSFLRGPFLAPVPERRGGVPRRVVMAMGGADPLRLTPKMLSVLLGVDPELRVEVIAGDTVDVGEVAEPGRVRVHRRLSAQEVADLFDSCDLGVFPASTICVEAFARRLPVIAGYFVDNQEEFFARGVSAGWFGALGDLRAVPAALAARLKEILEGEIPPSPDFDFPARRQSIVQAFKEL